VRRGDRLAHPHFTPERIRRFVAEIKDVPPARIDMARLVNSELNNATEAMATSFAALGTGHRDLLISMLDAAPGPVGERELAHALRRHRDGALLRPRAKSLLQGTSSAPGRI
jgi:hypothetical protein